MTLRVFLGYDERERAAYEVCAWSLKAAASIPVDIRPISDDEVDKQLGWAMDRTRPTSTAFSYARFAIPALCGYDGLALFMDGSDMLVLGDIAEVAALPMEGLAIRCTQLSYTPGGATKFLGSKQTAYPRKLWSSFMLLNCSELARWDRDAVERGPGSALHQFQTIPDEKIGAIPPHWNEVDALKPDTRCFHWTEWSPWTHPQQSPENDLWYQARADFCRFRGRKG
jgi:hypothetical protein